MIEKEIMEFIEFSPVLGMLLYINALMARSLVDRDRRINELIDRCINPCLKGQEKPSALVDVDNGDI